MKVINLSGRFDYELAEKISNQIRDINDSGQAISHIELRINSYGGCAASCFHIINAIRFSAIPVVTVATGVASSSGFLTLLAGHERYGTKYSVYLSHKGISGHYGNDNEIAASLERDKIYDKLAMDLYCDVLGKDKAWVKENLLKDFDTWLSPQQAKKLGIISKVV